MISLTRSSWIAAVSLSAMVAAAPSDAQRADAPDGTCDRMCMRIVMDQYFAAVFKHDAQAAPLAPSARATENAAPLANGEGIWKSMTGYGAVQRRYFDTMQNQAAYFGILNEGSDPAIVSVRFKLDGRLVTETEWTVAREAYGGLFLIDGLTSLPPPSDTPIPTAQRSSRAQLIAMANAYFDGLESKNGSAIPHVDGCERIENGVKVTHRLRAELLPPPAGVAPAAAPAAPPPTGMSGDCAADMDTVGANISEAAYRRFPVVDEETGVVLGSTIFHRPPGRTIRRNLLSEYFYGNRGQISAIYAAMYYLDPSAPDSSGW